MADINSLPPELLTAICRELAPTVDDSWKSLKSDPGAGIQALTRFAATSQRMNAIATPIIYAHASHHNIWYFAEAFVRRPELATFVKTVAIGVEFFDQLGDYCYSPRFRPVIGQTTDRLNMEYSALFAAPGPEFKCIPLLLYLLSALPRAEKLNLEFCFSCLYTLPSFIQHGDPAFTQPSLSMASITVHMGIHPEKMGRYQYRREYTNEDIMFLFRYAPNLTRLTLDGMHPCFGYVEKDWEDELETELEAEQVQNMQEGTGQAAPPTQTEVQELPPIIMPDWKEDLQHVKELSFIGGWQDEWDLAASLSHMPLLEHFSYVYAGCPPDHQLIGPDASISPAKLVSRLALHPQLKSLHIDFTRRNALFLKPLSPMKLIKSLKEFSSLETLKLDGLCIVAYAQHPNCIPSNCLRELLPKSLQSLELTINYSGHLERIRALAQDLPAHIFPRLETVIVNGERLPSLGGGST